MNIIDIRKTVVSGSFYPETKEEIKRYIEHFNSNFTLDNEFEIDIKALIVPHAGYIYSGFTANLAYNIASRQNFENIIVIGPSHRHYLQGASISTKKEYETPLGNIEINLKLVNNLKEKFDFLCFEEDAHFEHSTETQAPFIKNYFPSAKIVEIIYGNLDFKKLSRLTNELLKKKNNLIVISSDLSHFYDLKKANYLDNICLNAIKENNIEKLDKGCEACGKIGIKAIINNSIKNKYINKFLHYCTSFDQTNDNKSVVGYSSFLIGKKLN